LWNAQERLFQRSGERIIDDEMRRTSLTPEQAQQLGQLLSARRIEMGLSMRQLAREVGGNMSTISVIEAGSNLSPTPETLKGIARAAPAAD
jgi:DNA-binding XRE family transcriptional regulator